MPIFSSEPIDLPPGTAAFRRHVRDVIARAMPDGLVTHRANSWTVSDAQFSRALGAAGMLGMTWPRGYGGQDRSALERYIVLEELLAAGAPVGFHWIADRQTGPLLLRYGSEAQRERWLPGMAAGDVCACIGLSEPGAGSDLAAVQASARRDGEDWLINGQKVWTTNAHNAHIMIALVRSQAGSERNAGLSQFLIPMDAPGVTIRPIIDLTGSHEFNEVFFDDVRLPADALVGKEGDGWTQVTAELSLERAGPERYLSSMALFLALIDHVGPDPAEPVRGLIGRHAAELWTLRLMSLSVAVKLAAGQDPMLDAAIVKDLGNSLEQDLPVLIQASVEIDPTDSTPLSLLLMHLLQISPSFSLRGGTREILRGIIARGLGLR